MATVLNNPAGQIVNLPVLPNAELQFGFEPGSGIFTREDDSLVITFEDGGKIVLDNFYAHSKEELPQFIIEDTPFTAEQFLAQFSDDSLLPAAGPAAAPAAAVNSSGSGEYADDAGNLIDGVGRLGALGNNQWTRDTGLRDGDLGLPGGTSTSVFTPPEPPEPPVPPAPPEGKPSIDITTALGAGNFAAGVYEDGQPYQYLGDHSVFYGQLHFGFTTSNNTVVDAIRMSGFTAGTKLYIGVPGEPGTVEIEITSESQVVSFSPSSFANGVYLLPPTNNTDVDMQVTYQADLRNTDSGLTGTVTDRFTVVVDAVADRPEDITGVVTDDGNASHSMQKTVTQDEKVEDGYDKTQYTVTAGSNEAKVDVAFSVTATFSDYDDGSELHYVLVEQLPGFTGPYNTVEVNGVTYFQIPVSNADIAANNGTITVPVTLHSAQVTTDTNFSVRTGAMAVETPSDTELTLDNNVAYNFDQNTVNFSVDVINSSLNISTGWAYEGNDASKHTTAPYSPNYNGMDSGAGVDSASTTASGAPIELSLSGAQGSAEVISSVTFTYDGARGDLIYTGPGTAVFGTDAQGNTTLTISGINAVSLSGLHFRPATSGPQSYNDDDVALSYKVTVVNGAGASATFSGSSTVLIDAVADLSTAVSADINGQNTVVDTTPQGTVSTGGTDAAAPDANTGWETDTFTNVYTGTGYALSVNIATSFPDTDGSEKHYILVEQPTGWTLGNLPAGYADAGFHTGNDGKTYFKIEVLDPAQGTVNVNIPLATASVTGDMNSVTIKTGSLAVEQITDGEYDTANNSAERLDGTGITYSVDVINSTLTVKTGWASEGNNDAKHLGQPSTDYEYNGTQAGSTSTNADHSNNGAPIELSLSGAQGSAEVISSVTFTYDGARGDLIYTGPGTAVFGTDAQGNTTLTISGVNSGSLSGLHFRPATSGPQSYNDDDVALSYKVTVVNSAGASVTFDGSSTVVIDAVADRATDLNIGSVDYDNNASYTAASWDSTVTFKASATFSDIADGSEKHFILVEAQAGWSGNYNTTVVNGVTYFQIPVDAAISLGNGTHNGITVTMNADGSATVSLDVELTTPSKASGQITGDSSVTLKVGAMSEETSLGGREYDHGNNQAFNMGQTTIDFNVIDSTASSQANAAYEDHQPNQHQGNYAPSTADGNITLSLSASGNEHITDVKLSFTFEAGQTPGTFEYNGQQYTPTLSGGVWSVTIPAADVIAAGDSTSVTIRYNPPANDDTDLTNLNYSLGVASNNSSATGVHTGSITGGPAGTAEGTLVVDAVADKPTDVSGSVDYGSKNWGGTDHNLTAADKGSQITVTIKTTFYDFEDGSEEHYVLVNIPAGLNYDTNLYTQLTPAEITALNNLGAGLAVNGIYLKIDASSYINASGQVSIPLTLTVSNSISVNANTGNATVSLGVIAWAHEKAADGEITTSNNDAFTKNNVNINVSTVGSGTIATTNTYEDHMPNKHTGSTSQDSGGTIKLNLGDSGEQVEKLTLTVKGDLSAQGELVYGGTPLVGVYDPASNTTKFVINNYNPSTALRYNPAQYNDQDVKFDWSAEIRDPSSGATGTKTGSNVTIIVDAVADQAKNVEVDPNASYEGGQTSAKDGEAISFNVKAQFFDYEDNSENHYLLIEAKPGWTAPIGSNGLPIYETVTFQGGTYFKVPVDNAALRGTADGTITTNVSLVTPPNGTGADNTVRLGVKVVSQEDPSDSELTLNNNVAVVNGSVDVDIARVNSGGFTAKGGAVYENDAPNSHLGDESKAGGINVKITGDLDPTDYISSVTISGVAAEDGYFVYNGTVYTPDPSGSITLSFGKNDPPFDTSKLKFIPDGNGSGKLNLTIDVEVTDKSSNAVDHFNTTAEINVDAVANQPVLGDDNALNEGVTADYGATGGTTAFVRGGDVVLKAEVTFRDFADGSEKHFLLVEAKPGWPAPHNITLVDANGNPVLDGNGNPVTVPVNVIMQPYNGAMYYRVEVPNEYIDQYGVNGKLNVQIWMDSPNNATDTNFKVGAMAWEDVKKLGDDTEIRYDNNTSVVINDTDVTVKFDKVGGLSLTPQGEVYENDTPNAHTGDNTPAGGTRITINHDADDKVSDFRFTNYDTDKGTLYYLPNGASVGAGYEIPANGFVGDIKDGWSFVFIPAKNYSDEDVSLSYTATVKNQNSGDSHTVGGGATIIVDAVAQQPEDPGVDGPNIYDVTHSTKTGEGNDASQTITVKVQATFQDYEDSSEQHFILVEAKANMVINDASGNPYGICYAPDGKQYFKIPVSNADIQAGNGTVSIDVDLTIYSRKLALDHTSDTLKVGAMSQETNLSGGEITYDNNTSFNWSDGSGSGGGGGGSGGDITINHDWPGGYVIWVDPAYENNTRNANQDDPTQPGMQPDERDINSPFAGGKIHFGFVDAAETEAVTSVDLTWNSSRGSIWVNGTLHTSGPITVSGADLDNMYFVPNKDYDDADTKLGYVAHGANGNTASGDFTIIVDAVAQMPENLTSDVDYGAGYTAAGANDGHGNDGTVTVKIGGDFADNDGSEKHYALIEKQPGFSLQTPHDEVYYGGKTYYRVEIPSGQNSVDVQLKIDGTSDYTLKTGLMTEEINAGTPGNYEATTGNNTSWNLEGEVTIEFSLVDTVVSVNIPNQYEFTPGMAAVPVIVDWTVGNHDTLNFIEFTYDASKGVIDYTGNKGGGNYHLIDNGNGTFTLRLDNPTDADKDKFTFRPNDYSDSDVNISWRAEAADSKSGDVKVIGNNVNVIVDAVAQAPDIIDHSVGAADGQHEAALSGGSAVASVTLSFADRDGSETHYAVLQQDGIWKCDQVEINGQFYQVKTVFSENGTPYYAVEITNAMLAASDPVKVDFILNAPARTADAESTLKIGGISIEATTGDGSDKELTLHNNWAESLNQSVTVKLAVVDATDVTLSNTTTLIEDDATGAALKMTGITDPNEIITKIEYTVTQVGAAPGSVIGTIWYNGSAYELVAGAGGEASVTINFGAGGFDPSADYRFVAADQNGNFNHNSNDIKVETTSTVEDTKSGDTKTFDASHTINVQATADAPTDIDVTNPTYNAGTSAVGASANVTFSVSAKFADIDGSENHYILVEQKPGWTGSYSVINISGVNYFRVPVSSTAANPTVNITLKTPANATDGPVDLIVGGMAVDGSDTKYTFEPGDQATINIGVVDTTSVTSGNQTVNEGDSAIITLAINGNNESIAKVVFNAPATGVIYYDGVALSAVGGKITINNFDSSKELKYYGGDHVKGDHTLTYTATVKDAASGVTKDFNGSTQVSITPVTDTPVDPDGTASGPVDQAGHTALTTITLQADFVDNSGTEHHFFLVSLPAGLAVPAGWTPVTDSALLAASAMSGTVYMVTADAAGAGTFTLTVPAHFAGGDIAFKAGSSETGLVPPVYQFSSEETASVAPTGEINIAPTAQHSEGILGEHDSSFHGTLAVSDPDGDTWAVTKVSFDGQDHNMPTDGSPLLINSDHGVLEINADGSYIYTLNNGVVATDVNSIEHFSYTVTDQFGAHSDNAIDITLGTPPAPLSGFASAAAAFSAAMDADHSSIVGTDSHDVLKATDYSDDHLGYALHGGTENDSILGDEGPALLAGEIGDTIFFGAIGGDTFQWNKTGFGETDTVKDCYLDAGCKINLHDLFSDAGSLADVLVTGPDCLINNDCLEVASVDNGSLQLTVISAGNPGQTIMVHGFDSEGTSIGQAYDNADSLAEKLALLQHIITVNS